MLASTRALACDTCPLYLYILTLIVHIAVCHDGVAFVRAFAARMTEGQAEARWEALPARFDWAVKAAEDGAAEGEMEGELVGEEALGVEQTVREDGAVEGVREAGMSAVAELKGQRKGSAGFWSQCEHGRAWMRRRAWGGQTVGFQRRG